MTPPRPAEDAPTAQVANVTPSSGDAPAGVFDRWHDRLVDTESRSSMSSSFRSQRWRMLATMFPDLDQMKVLDLGGTVDSWALAPARPAHLAVLNVEVPVIPVPDGIEVMVGDACQVPTAVEGQSWDLVYSNSVIEHLGGHERRCAFAASVRSLAPNHWVQTPYRYFPIEPHFLFPGLQFLPTPARAAVIRHWPLNKWRPADDRTAIQAALDLELLGRVELEYYFPESTLLRERVAGLTKSLIVAQRGVR